MNADFEQSPDEVTSPPVIRFSIPENWTKEEHLKHPLVQRYREQVIDVVNDPDLVDGEDVTAEELLYEQDFYSIAVGFALAYGLNAGQAMAFATFTRYNLPDGV